MKPIDIDYYELKEILKAKKLICFGAGKGLENFAQKIGHDEFVSKIEFIVDNDEQKQNTFKELFGRKVQIKSFEYLLKYSSGNSLVILITVADCEPIFHQLQQYSQLNDVDCCLPVLITSKTHETAERERKYPVNYRITKEIQIPKKIHYCWFGESKIPEKNLKWMESWKKYCPDYEIIEWNESNYDISKNKYMYEAYKAKKWGFVPDYARMDIIYEHGGIYLDTDVELIKSLDELLYQNAFAGVDISQKVSLGLGFGSKPGNNLFKQLLELYRDRSFEAIVPAPMLQADLWRELKFIENGELQYLDGITIYPEKVLSGKDFFTGKISPTKDTFAIHHYDASWVDKEQLEKQFQRQSLYKEFFYFS